MNFLLRLVAFVLTIAGFDIGATATAQEISNLQIKNPIAQHMIKSLAGKTHFNGWTVDTDSSRNSNDRSGEDGYALAATASLFGDDANPPALLSVNCIPPNASVSLIFDGNGHQFTKPMPITISIDNGPQQQEIARPMLGRDTIGIFQQRAFLTVQSMRNANFINISFPEIGKSWKFSLLGLNDAIVYMKDKCDFSAQGLIDAYEMKSLQFWLRQNGYKVSTNGDFDKNMKKVILQLQKKYGLKETGQIDGPTYDLILRTFPQ